jgi:hypothetical protein
MPRRKRKSNWSAPKASTTARGYGSRHQAERRRWEPIVATGGVLCVRCHLPIPVGSRWHLDHEDNNIHYRGPAHASCNVKAAAKRGNAIRRVLHSGRIPSRDW